MDGALLPWGMVGPIPADRQARRARLSGALERARLHRRSRRTQAACAAGLGQLELLELVPGDVDRLAAVRLHDDALVVLVDVVDVGQEHLAAVAQRDRAAER